MGAIHAKRRRAAHRFAALRTAPVHAHREVRVGIQTTRSRATHRSASQRSASHRSTHTERFAWAFEESVTPTPDRKDANTMAIHAADTAPNIREAAWLYVQAGLCALPAVRKGSDKRVGLSSWKRYQTERPSAFDLQRWFQDGGVNSVCIVCGAVSGNLEMIDFDTAGEAGAASDEFTAWRDAVELAAPGLFDRLVIQCTPSGGRHAIYRCEAAVAGNMKLAQRRIDCEGPETITIDGKGHAPRRDGDDAWRAVITLIETRGEGGLFLCAPSEGYSVGQGRLAEPPVLTPEEREILLQAARELDETPREIVTGGEPAWTPAPVPRGDGQRPGEDFNARGDVRWILQNHGWRLTRTGAPGTNEHWLRPGKAAGTSATLKPIDDVPVFYVFSSNAPPFEAGKAYTPFAVYALLEHGGDFAAAAAALALEGYGDARAAHVDYGVDLSGFAPLNGSAAVVASEPPEPPPAPDLEPTPFPEQLLDVPGFIARLMAYDLATATRPQPVLALAGAVCAQAVLAARKVRDQRGNRTNLYCVGVARTGAGKNNALRSAQRVLHNAGMERHMWTGGVASDAGLVKSVEQEPSRLFLIDEFGRFLATIGDAKKAPHLYQVVSALMALYSSADSAYATKAYADDARNKVIDQPCVSLLGMTTPNRFYESLTSESVQDGFVGRMLVFETSGLPQRSRPDDVEPPEALIEAARWWGEFRPGGNLSGVHPRPLLVRSTPEADAVFDELADQVDTQLAGDDESAQALWARAEEKACRLALVYACSADRESPVIDGDAARWACGLARHITESMMRAVKHWVSDSIFDARQKKVVRIMQRAGGQMTGFHFARATQRMSKRERDEVLENLIVTGQVRVDEVASDAGKGGRPRIVYTLVGE
ncbi:MAG: DUF3987 domain-containing protein [Phycisphaeraceae bacterium]|nr:MAG: DUF3987 domain-containing protein [Phycisphaeraceae bacterium]